MSDLDDTHLPVWTHDRDRHRNDPAYRAAQNAWAEGEGLPTDLISLTTSWPDEIYATDQPGEWRYSCWVVVPPDGWVRSDDSEVPPGRICEHDCCGQAHTVREHRNFTIHSLPPVD
jgi:hypothetical protein